MLTITPFPRASIPGATAMAMAIGALRSSTIEASAPPSSSVGPTTCLPALFTSTSTGPSAASAPAIQSVQWARSDKSVATR